MWAELTFGEMKIVHPLYVVGFDTEQLLIGQDLLNRLTPLIDYHSCQLWAQVRIPRPIEETSSGQKLCNAVELERTCDSNC